MFTNPFRRPKPTSQSFNAFWIPPGLSAAISPCCSCFRKQVGSIYFHFLKRLRRNNFLTAGHCSFRKHYSEHLGCIIFRSVVRNQNTVCGMTQYKLCVCVCVCVLCNEGACQPVQQCGSLMSFKSLLDISGGQRERGCVRIWLQKRY